MPANVETMTYTTARGVPWHGLGKPVDGLMTAAEAVEAAGLDWHVVAKPIQTVDGEPIDMKVANVRDTDGKVVGVVGNGYTIVQNRDAFDFADAIVADGGAHFETAGSLNGGRTVFLSIELSAVEPIKVEGDDSNFKPFLLLRNTHDGSSALSGCVTMVRGVCENTVNLAFSGAKQQFNIRHSGDPTAKMQQARDALGISVDYAKRFEAVANALMAVEVTEDRATKILRDAFGMRESIEAKGVDSDMFVNHHATRTLELLNTAADLAPIKGTGWGVLQAVAEYIDHDRQYGKGSARDALDIKATSILWGQGQDVLNRTAVLIDPKVAKMMSADSVRGAKRLAVRVKVA